MAHKNFNRMRGTATAPGTGSFTLALGSAAQTFGSRLASTNTVWYTATDNISKWEVGYGTFTSPATLARTTILESSNADLVVDFDSGSVDVFCDLPASVADTLNLIEETVTSAATFNIGAIHALRILASGTTGPITSFGTTPNKLRIVRWAGSILTHNATTLILLGGVSRTTATGDIGIYASDASGNWRELSYQRADGHPLTTGHSTIASATTTDLGSVLGQSIIVSGTTTITGFGSTAPTGAIKSVEFSGALILTHNATSLILPGAANITTVAGDTMSVRHEGSGNWRVISYTKVSQAFSVHKNGTAQTGIGTSNGNGSVVVALTFGTEVYDDGNAFASNAWTPRAGLIELKGRILFDGSLVSAANKLYIIQIWKNGAVWRTNAVFSSAAGQYLGVPINVEDKANGTDVYDLRVEHTDAATQSVLGLTAGTYFTGHTA